MDSCFGERDQHIKRTKKSSIMLLNNFKIYLTIALIAITTTLKAQDLLIGIGGGGGTFGMNSTKEFNQILINQLPFKPGLTDNFPPYFFYKAEALYCFPKNMAIGINLSTTSTGSRLTLADYSGKYTLDNIQKGFFSVIKILLGNAPGRSNGFNFSLEGGVAFSKMTIKEELKISEESTKDNMDFASTGFYVQPGICYYRIINSKVRIAANLSYYFGIEKGYHLPNEKDQRLTNSTTQEPVKPQWDGIRFGITAYWSLRKHSK
jgi:hypothetical protein